MTSWFANLSIKTRLIAIFALVIAVIVVVGSTGIMGMKQSNQNLEKVVNALQKVPGVIDVERQTAANAQSASR